MNKLTDSYIFQTSWEVCNKVGGIYTVLSTVAASLHKSFGDNLVFIGPDFHVANSPYFEEDKSLFADFIKESSSKGLSLRAGHWLVPGNPQVVLVDFQLLMDKRDEFFYLLWQNFAIDSMNTTSDYVNNVMFGYAAGRVVEAFAKFYKINKAQSVAQFHEWQTASGLLYLKMKRVGVKTVFTTHATTVGRSICFNNKQLYQYFNQYFGDQMSHELGVVAQHAIEKQGAVKADCFTTVSDFTARECHQLIGKSPDVVTPNGFEPDFVPVGKAFDAARAAARQSLSKVAESLMGYKLDSDALFIGIAGRCEFRNKGIDVFIETLQHLNQNSSLNKQIVAFLMIPGWINGPRRDLQNIMANPQQKYALADVVTTHELHQPQSDDIARSLSSFGLNNNADDKVKVVYIPALLDGADGIFNKSYYDLLIGLDMTVFPSYYEPWGYTPMESAAFHIPTITTDLAGFGLWVSSSEKTIENGVAVLHRDDQNRAQLIDSIANQIISFSQYPASKVQTVRTKAAQIVAKASWSDFVKYYLQAFAFACGDKEFPKISSATVAKPTVVKSTAAKDAPAKAPAAKTAPAKATPSKAAAKPAASKTAPTKKSPAKKIFR